MSKMDFVGRSLADQLRESLQTLLPRKETLSFARVARENLQIRTMDNRVTPFVLRRLQKRYLARKRLARMRGDQPRFLLLKYRRGGYTTLEQGLSYFMATRNRNVTVMTLAQDGDTTSRIFRIAKLMHERDPKAPKIKGPGHSTRLEFPGINSLFYIGTAAGRAVARGDTLSRVHWSEVAWSCLGFNQHIKQRDILTGISEAASQGEMVLETTPNGSELFRELYMDAKMGKNEWTPIFLPWFSDLSNQDVCSADEEAYILNSAGDPDEDRVRKAQHLTGGQVKWRRRKLRELKHLFYQEYPEDDETCWLVSGVPFFDPNVVLELRDFCRGPELIDDPHLGMIPKGCRPLAGGYEIEYKPPQHGRTYCMGVDSSEGIPGCDRSGLGVMERETGEQVFSLHGLFNPRVLAHHAVRVSKLYNEALVGIERENHGHAVIQKCIDLGLERSHNRGGSLYFHSLAKAQYGERTVSKAGWSTNAITRPLMLEGLRDWLETDGALARVFDRQMLQECMTFRMQDNGSFEHDPGCHDDSIVKWAIANQMRVVNWRRAQMHVMDVSRWTRG